MALADYKRCDVCGSKAFYDANLSYTQGPSDYSDAPPFRSVGVEQIADPALRHNRGTRLGYLGDWAVLCQDCAKTHKTAILPIGEEDDDA